MRDESRLPVFTHLPPGALARVERHVPGVEWIPISEDGELPGDARAEVLLTFTEGGPRLEEVLARGVRWVHTIGTGVDRFPVGALGDRILSCARGASAVPIAEWVMAAVLAHAKHLPQMWMREAPERWNMAPLDTLEGRSLGLVGLGGIGAAVASRARAFGMRVRAVRRRAGSSPVAGVELAPGLEELLGGSDHLVLAAPATPATRHLIGQEALRHVRRGLHLVNVARGSLVDQEALREALDDGRVARASLDVCEPEPLPAGHWLYGHPRVLLSPHVSWAAPGAFDALVATFGENLARWRRGEPLEGVVDVAAGY